MAQALSRRVRELEGCIALLTGMEGELSYSLAPPTRPSRGWRSPGIGAGGALPARLRCPLPEGNALSARRGGRRWKSRAGASPGRTPRLVEALADTLGQCDLDGQLLEPFPREGAARHAAGRGPRTVRIPRQALPHDGPFGGSLCGGLFHLMPVLRKQAACGGREAPEKRVLNREGQAYL